MYLTSGETSAAAELLPSFPWRIDNCPLSTDFMSPPLHTSVATRTLTPHTSKQEIGRARSPVVYNEARQGETEGDQVKIRHVLVERDIAEQHGVHIGCQQRDVEHGRVSIDLFRLLDAF